MPNFILDVDAIPNGTYPTPDSDNSSYFSTISPALLNTSLQSRCNLSSIYPYVNGGPKVGSFVEIQCSDNLGVGMKVWCLPNFRLTMTRKQLLVFCRWSLRELSYVNMYALQPFAVLLLTMTSILLIRSKMYNSRRQMRLRLYTWLVLTLDFYCSEHVIYTVTNHAVKKYKDLELLSTVCAVHLLFSRFLLQVAYMWLFNTGLFLCWSILHPLNPWSIKMWQLKIVAFGIPLLLTGSFSVVYGVKVEWTSFYLCYMPKKARNLTYMVMIPSAIIDMSGYLFVFLITRRVHSYQERRKNQRFLSYYRNIKNIYKHENSVKKFFWLFILLGQWRILSLVPIWTLRDGVRAGFVTIRETIITICFCLITIPVCFKNPDMRSKLSPWRSLSSHLPSRLRHTKLSVENHLKLVEIERSDLQNRTTSLYKY